MDAAVALVQAPPQGNGVGPVPAVASADPAIVALLQELLGESTGDRCAPGKRREQSSVSAATATPTGAAGTPASASSPRAGRRQRLQHGICDKTRNTQQVTVIAGVNFKRQASG